MARRHHNPWWILPSRVETRHSTSNMSYYARPLFTDTPRAFSPAASEWRRVTESERHSKLSLSVSDPLQRDANQVHLPATQRLLAAHHASEQRGRSLQLPRYRHEAANYHTHGAAISSPARVSGNVWSSEGRGDGKTAGETGRRAEGVLYSGMEGLSLYVPENITTVTAESVRIKNKCLILSICPKLCTEQ